MTQLRIELATLLLVTQCATNSFTSTCFISDTDNSEVQTWYSLPTLLSSNSLQMPPATQLSAVSLWSSYMIRHCIRPLVPKVSVNVLPSINCCYEIIFCAVTMLLGRTAVAQWLSCCATNRKVAVSIPTGVTGIFYWRKILPIALQLWGRLSL